ncbi:MAG: hypothetical protein ACLRSH_00830 [Turicibacter sp.]
METNKKTPQDVRDQGELYREKISNEYSKLEELCHETREILDHIGQSMISYLKQQYATYGEVLKRLELFKKEIQWSMDDGLKGFKLQVVDYVIQLVRKEMNDLQITNYS